YRVVYKDDKEEGNYIIFDENSKLQELGHFNDGKKTGVAFKFYENGRIKERIFYKNNGDVVRFQYDDDEETTKDIFPNNN
ncbi:MAG: toxin-antitoxin system YwqK family antitoxin, partial [Fusobacterium varium]